MVVVESDGCCCGWFIVSDEGFAGSCHMVKVGTGCLASSDSESFAEVKCLNLLEMVKLRCVLLCRQYVYSRWIKES